MIQKIRTSKATKVIACYLALMIFLQITAPVAAYALTGGPTQPEFSSFTPIGTSDMVDLASGDLNYNIPIMDVGGYPINLAYNSGVTMDQEASWVGLGWDLNVGQIARQMRGIPDDFDGDEMIYENNMKDNVTVGGSANVFFTLFGIDESAKGSVSVGFGAKYNNYDGFGFSLNGGISYQIAENLSVGMQLSSSASEGVNVTPAISLHAKYMDKSNRENDLSGSLGVVMNSRKGVEGLTMSAQNKRSELNDTKYSSVGSSLSFANASYTPTKRVGMTSSNFTFNLNLEIEAFGAEPGAKFSGYMTSQGIKDSEKYKVEKAYGFENTYNATDNDILDFNREKDRTFTQFTASLPVTNNTYDLYSIQGQGISGMFRPYKGQVGYVYDNRVNDDTFGGSAGLELGAGGGTHWGIDASVSTGKSSTGVWRNGNPAINSFEEKNTGNRLDYEKIYFKNIGGTHVDNELNLADIGQYDPAKIEIGGSAFARTAQSSYIVKKLPPLSAETRGIGPNGIKRENRVKRTQAIQKLTREDVLNYSLRENPDSPLRGQLSPYSLMGKHDHHTSEIRIIKDGGERYIYGRAAYNVVKREVTFDVSGTQGDCKSGLVSYVPGKHNSKDNKADGDRYFNRITTPAYAHTYLLTSVLSSDYVDIKDDGLTDDDLGSDTKFTYDDSKSLNNNTYKWRVPYNRNMANYDEGLRSSEKDDKGNYIYGEKELLYIKTIETKTHIAVFHISERKDGYGVDGENGGGSQSTTSKMYKLDKISLYSKPEYLAQGEDAVPIKEAHFVYDYYLCPGVYNNFNGSPSGNELLNQGGKLTLRKVFFTYRNSNMGRFAPYAFNYDNLNPGYDLKGYDTWGNYKETPEGAGCGINDALTNAEFPYVEQDDRELTDQYAAAWLLSSIDMPSGGKMEMSYESDDYRYVQDKEAMQMFKVVGVGRGMGNPTSESDFHNTLYDGSTINNKLYIKLPSVDADLYSDPARVTKLKTRYLRQLLTDPVYFRFLLNMTEPGSTNKYDYVTGYLQLEESGMDVFSIGNGFSYASIPIGNVQRGDGLDPSEAVNPIAKAGWLFGREYLSRLVYNRLDEEDTKDLEGIVMEIVNSVPAIFDIFKSPNGKLKQRGIASQFIKEKSWIRLMQPENRKVGGGSRASEIRIHDQWQVMTDHETDDVYKQFYGQRYSYETEADANGDTHTSGVATYEPLGNKENPLVQPFYDRTNPGLLLGPDSQNYVEKPIGESFFPSPKVTYGRVTVSNLPREKRDGETLVAEVKKHATGTVVTEFYTSFSYPTIADYTDLTSKYDKSGALASILNINVRDHLTLSQGYVIHTNDMEGKMKSQRVYAEGIPDFISGVDYNYEDPTDQGAANTSTNNGKLNNVITTIDSKGAISDKLVGVDYDVINDFRHSESVAETGGAQFNTAVLPFLALVLVIPTIIPSYSRHESVIKTAVTTKVIHTSGILREKVVYDLGAAVSTKNLAWDAETGEVLLTKTVNEYSDNYYSFNFPAYWAHDGMRQAAINLGMKCGMQNATGSGKYRLMPYTAKPSDYLTEGDELWIEPEKGLGFKAWVTGTDNNSFTLIGEDGIYVSENLDNSTLTVIRSGHRNMPAASMASITCMVNPIEGKTMLDSTFFTESSWEQYRIINASAIEYNDIWAAQCECHLPKMRFDTDGNVVFDYASDDEDGSNLNTDAYNPYRYNVKGNWRAKTSYAYLAGRNVTADATPRKTGFFNNFNPFYTYDSALKKWIVNQTNKTAKWTYASEVTQYSPFGFEVENRDALGRFSSALYGYNNKFPTAVAANTSYKELAYDGFEDYDFSTCDTTSHLNFNKSLTPQAISISSSQAHSGRKSLKLAPGNKAVVKKQIISCPPKQ